MPLSKPIIDPSMAVPARTPISGVFGGTGNLAQDFALTSSSGFMKDTASIAKSIQNGGILGAAQVAAGGSMAVPASSVQSGIKSMASKLGANVEFDEDTEFDDMNQRPEYTVHFYSPKSEQDIDLVAFLPENFSTGSSADYGSAFDFFTAIPGIKQAWGAVESFGYASGARNIARLAGFAPTIQPFTAQIWTGSSPISMELPLNFLLDTDTEKDVLTPLRKLLSLTMPKLYTSGQDGSGRKGGMLLKAPGPKFRIKRDNSPPTAKERSKGAVARALEGADNAVSDLVTSVIDGVATTQDVFNGADIDELFASLSESLGSMGLDNFEVVDNLVVRLGEFFVIPSVIITGVGSDWVIRLDRYTKRPIAISINVSIQSWVIPNADDLDVIIPPASVR